MVQLPPVYQIIAGTWPRWQGLLHCTLMARLLFASSFFPIFVHPVGMTTKRPRGRRSLVECHSYLCSQGKVAAAQRCAARGEGNCIVRPVLPRQARNTAGPAKSVRAGYGVWSLQQSRGLGTGARLCDHNLTIATIPSEVSPIFSGFKNMTTSAQAPTTSLQVR